jgi:uncharacterized protein YggE
MKSLIIVLALITTCWAGAQVETQPTVDVTGEGIVRVVPDEVTVQFRVENTGKNAALVKQENDRVVTNVLEFVAKMGIDSKDVHTEYIRLNKNYEYNTKTYNYMASNTMSVKLRDLKKYENVMNGLLETGINGIDHIQFGSSKEEQLMAESRQKAMLQAKEKAQQYAGALGQTIGRAVSISEPSSNNFPQPRYKAAVMMDSEGGVSGDQYTLAPGEMLLKTTVNVRFLLQ